MSSAFPPETRKPSLGIIHLSFQGKGSPLFHPPPFPFRTNRKRFPLPPFPFFILEVIESFILYGCNGSKDRPPRPVTPPPCFLRIFSSQIEGDVTHLWDITAAPFLIWRGIHFSFPFTPKRRCFNPSLLRRRKDKPLLSPFQAAAEERKLPRNFRCTFLPLVPVFFFE